MTAFLLFSLHNLFVHMLLLPCNFFFFFNDTATTEIYTLSLHALFRSHESVSWRQQLARHPRRDDQSGLRRVVAHLDRKSTRLNSSHSQISYAVFCLKKKKNTKHVD